MYSVNSRSWELTIKSNRTENDVQRTTMEKVIDKFVKKL